MKTTDFTKPGGFPLSQNRLGYMQDGYVEGIQAIGSVVDDNTTPVRVSGIAFSGGGAGTYSNGWLIYKSDLIRFQGSAGVALGGGDVVMVVVNDNATNLTYYNGSMPAVIKEKVASVYAGPPVTDATHFPYSALVDYGKQLGTLSREVAWTTDAIGFAGASPGSPNINGTIEWKKSAFDNTLRLSMKVTLTNVGNLAGAGIAWRGPIYTLPAEVIPYVGAGPGVYLTAKNILSGIKDHGNVYPITGIDVLIYNDGGIYISAERSIADMDYTIKLDAILSLD